MFYFFSIALTIFNASHSLPNNSDIARKRILADWVVKIKKQVVKVYAIVKWARDSGDVQKAMVCPFLPYTSVLLAH